MAGIEVEAEFLASAHQLHRAQGGFHVVDQLVRVRFVGEFDAVLAEFIQDLAPALHEFLFHIRPALGIRPGEEAPEILAADETGDHRHFQGIGSLGGLDHALGAEFDLLFLGAREDGVGILAIRTQNDLTFRVVGQCGDDQPVILDQLFQLGGFVAFDDLFDIQVGVVGEGGHFHCLVSQARRPV